MKLISLFVLGALAVSTNVVAQTTDPIQKALLAAPNAAMAKDATVIKPRGCQEMTGRLILEWRNSRFGEYLQEKQQQPSRVCSEPRQ